MSTATTTDSADFYALEALLDDDEQNLPASCTGLHEI
jgi:hypothetical protein